MLVNSFHVSLACFFRPWEQFDLDLIHALGVSLSVLDSDVFSLEFDLVDLQEKKVVLIVELQIRMQPASLKA